MFVTARFAGILLFVPFARSHRYPSFCTRISGKHGKNFLRRLSDVTFDGWRAPLHRIPQRRPRVSTEIHDIQANATTARTRSLFTVD